MKQEKLRKLPLYKNLVDVARTWIPGKDHTHDEIAEILGVPYRTPHFYYHVNMAAKQLRVYQIHLRNRSGMGYYVNLPDETLDLIGDKVDNISNRARDVIDIRDSTPYHKMSPHKAMGVKNIGDRLMGLLFLAKQTQQSIAQLSEQVAKIQINTSREKSHLLAVGETNGNETSESNS